MRNTLTKSLFLALALAPAAAFAQTGQGSGTPQSKTPDELSAQARAQLELFFERAESRSLPSQAIENRVAEGLAKGASETAIVASAGRVLAHLEASSSAMIAAGRSPSSEETTRGANAMERGVTSAQIEALAEGTPNERSLVTALEVLTDLAARGVPVDKALARIQAIIDARGTDAGLVALTNSGAIGLDIAAQARIDGQARGAAASDGRGNVGGSVSGTVTVGRGGH